MELLFGDFRFGGDDGARADRGDEMTMLRPLRRRRWCRSRSSAASCGVIDNRSENLQHRQWGALPRSLSAAAAADRKDQRNLAAFTTFAAPTRAREAAPIPVSSDADRPARAGCAALRLLADVDSSF